MPAEIPNMDELLAQSARSENRHHVRLGALLVGAGLATLVGVYELTGGSLYLVPTGAIGVGLVYLNRGLGRPR